MLYTQTHRHTHPDSFLIRDVVISYSQKGLKLMKQSVWVWVQSLRSLVLLPTPSNALTSCLGLVILPRRGREMAGKLMGVGGNAWLIFSPSQPQSDVYWESWCSRSLPDGLQMCLHLGRPSQETDAPAHSSHPGWIAPTPDGSLLQPPGFFFF